MGLLMLSVVFDIIIVVGIVIDLDTKKKIYSKRLGLALH